MQEMEGIIIVCSLVAVIVAPILYMVWKRQQRIRVEKTGEIRQALVLQSRSVWRRDASPDFKMKLRVPRSDGTTKDIHLTASFRGTMPLPPEGSHIAIVVDPRNEDRIYIADRDAFQRNQE